MKTGRRTTAALAAALVLAGCGGADTAEQESADATQATGTPTPTTTMTPAADPTPTTTATPTATPTTATDGDSAPAADLPPADTNDKEAAGFPDPTGETAFLTDVEIGDHPDYERVVFTFTDESVIPSWRVAYTDTVTESGSGRTVDVAGDAFLAVTMSGATGVRFEGEDIIEVYTGPERLEGQAVGADVVQEVVATGDFEATLDWAIGLDEQRPFRAFTLEDPSRVVVDVMTGG